MGGLVGTTLVSLASGHDRYAAIFAIESCVSFSTDRMAQLVGYFCERLQDPSARNMLPQLLAEVATTKSSSIAPHSFQVLFRFS